MIGSIGFIRMQSLTVGANFVVDPFLQLTGAKTTPIVQKFNKPDPSCISNGALAGSIIGTLILSAFVGFLTWLIYLRPKFQGFFLTARYFIVSNLKFFCFYFIALHYMHLHEKRRTKPTQQYQRRLPIPSSPKFNSQQQYRKQSIDDGSFDYKKIALYIMLLIHLYP